MAKGDFIKITMVTAQGPYETGMTITVAGRSLKRASATRARVKWIDVTEVNQNGRPTGDSVSVREDSILSLVEHKVPTRPKAAR